MKLVMFTPRDRELARGWPGRVDDDHVTQFAAQTLEAFFTGGGTAREHAEYSLEDVVLRAPVLRPPSIRVFKDERRFTFANTASIYGPDAFVPWPEGAREVEARFCVAAVIGAEGHVGGYTLANVWRCDLEPPKDADFGISLGPWVATEDEYEPRFPWPEAVAHAALNTRLRAGDVLVAPPDRVEPVARGGEAAYSDPVLGRLRNVLA